tara:strand:+ start:879 stop:1607 length:729 start_codon:yes stop_codon:yes gene_type:complete
MIKYFTLIVLKFFDFLHQKKIINFLKKKGNQKFEYLFDVGAHKGETINLFIKNFKVEKIYSFEPSLKSFNELKTNVKKLLIKNKYTKIFLENSALGNEEGEIRLKQMQESSSSTINEINTNSKYFKRKSLLLYKNENKNFYSEIIVQQKKLSNFIEKNGIPKIDFLKIDTEGYELNVLLGLEKHFKKISLIMFEHHYHNMLIKKYKFSDIHELLTKNNFLQIFKNKMPFRKTFEYIYERKQN